MFCQPGLALDFRQWQLAVHAFAATARSSLQAVAQAMCAQVAGQAAAAGRAAQAHASVLNLATALVRCLPSAEQRQMQENRRAALDAAAAGSVDAAADGVAPLLLDVLDQTPGGILSLSELVVALHEDVDIPHFLKEKLGDAIADADDATVDLENPMGPPEALLATGYQILRQWVEMGPAALLAVLPPSLPPPSLDAPDAKVAWRRKQLMCYVRTVRQLRHILLFIEELGRHRDFSDEVPFAFNAEAAVDLYRGLLTQLRRAFPRFLSDDHVTALLAVVADLFRPGLDALPDEATVADLRRSMDAAFCVPVAAIVAPALAPPESPSVVFFHLKFDEVPDDGTR